MDRSYRRMDRFFFNSFDSDLINLYIVHMYTLYLSKASSQEYQIKINYIILHILYVI